MRRSRRDTIERRWALDERAANDWMNPPQRDQHSLKRLLARALDDALIASLASTLVNGG
jgi:putative SOS response-associated peptidase YedK